MILPGEVPQVECCASSPSGSTTITEDWHPNATRFWVAQSMAPVNHMVECAFNFACCTNTNPHSLCSNALEIRMETVQRTSLSRRMTDWTRVHRRGLGAVVEYNLQNNMLQDMNVGLFVLHV
jgi:hypothetical protein